MKKMSKKLVKLFPHQLEALNQTKGKNLVAYYLDMGLGKTFVATEKAEQFDENIIVIVCQKSKIEDWRDHYKEYYPQYNVIVYKKKVEKLDPNTVIIINYDLVWRRDEFKKLRNFTLILDESSYIKNTTSKRTKFILRMKPTNVILLSGTPTGGKYEELYSQITLLGWKVTVERYWATYIKYFKQDVGGFKIKRVTGYKNVERLKRKLREHGAVFMKTEDVIELPETIEYKLKVSSTSHYKKFEKDRLVEIEGVELVGDTSLTNMLYLRQLASMYNPNKYEKVKELLEGTEDRLLIFYNFKNERIELEKICKKLNKPISRVDGETRDLSNYERLENAVTLIQYQAGSMGLNLQKANTIIYFSLPLSSDLFEQSKKRTHRLGQTRSCFYYYLLTENSIDNKIFETLELKKDYTEELFKQWNN